MQSQKYCLFQNIAIIRLRRGKIRQWAGRDILVVEGSAGWQRCIDFYWTIPEKACTTNSELLGTRGT